jgi:hypothetical protein
VRFEPGESRQAWLKRLTDDGRGQELAAWRREHRWHPKQLCGSTALVPNELAHHFWLSFLDHRGLVGQEAPNAIAMIYPT